MLIHLEGRVKETIPLSFKPGPVFQTVVSSSSKSVLLRGRLIKTNRDEEVLKKGSPPLRFTIGNVQASAPERKRANGERGCAYRV